MSTHTIGPRSSHSISSNVPVAAATKITRTTVDDATETDKGSRSTSRIFPRGPAEPKARGDPARSCQVTRTNARYGSAFTEPQFDGVLMPFRLAMSHACVAFFDVSIGPRWFSADPPVLMYWRTGA